MKHVTKIPSVPVRLPDSHKGDFGRVLVVAGSVSMPGAAVLASRSALRAGAGLVTLAIPRGALAVAQSHLIEATFLPLPETPKGHVSKTARKMLLEKAGESKSVVLGPGLGTDLDVKAVVYDLVRKARIPLLLDADGLNVLGEDLRVLADRESPTVLTPHPGEMARLFGIGTKEIQSHRAEFASRCADRSRAVVVLKGHRSLVTDGERIFENHTGNPGMATAGSGDVLSGLIGAFLARGMEAFEAAVLAVHLHGIAGDLAAQKFGQESMIASDLIASLPEAFTLHSSRR